MTNYFSAQRSAHHPRFAAVSVGRGGVSVQNSDYPRLHVFVVSVYARSVNADTDFAQAPSVELGRVLRNIIGRILYLRRRLGPRARVE